MHLFQVLGVNEVIFDSTLVQSHVYNLLFNASKFCGCDLRLHCPKRSSTQLARSDGSARRCLGGIRPDFGQLLLFFVVDHILPKFFQANKIQIGY